MKTLTVSLYNRPEYTEKTLQHLSECFDIENYQVGIFCEPGNKKVIELAQEFTKAKHTFVVVNKTRLGCNANIYQCLMNGFSTNDYHIHIEDDTVPGKDALLYFEWARHEFKEDPTVYTVTAYSKNNNPNKPIDQEKYVVKNRWFTPWGWATWKDRWQSLIQPALYKHCVEMGRDLPSWDIIVTEARQNRYEVYPRVARTQNIGGCNGTYCPGPEWHKNNQYNQFWIESTQKYQTTFNLEKE